MRSPTSLHESRVYSPENFWSPVEKDFCNNIGIHTTPVAGMAGKILRATGLSRNRFVRCTFIFRLVPRAKGALLATRADQYRRIARECLAYTASTPAPPVLIVAPVWGPVAEGKETPRRQERPIKLRPAQVVQQQQQRLPFADLFHNHVTHSREVEGAVA